MPILNDWLKKHTAVIREDLFTFLRFKTISSDPAYKEEHSRCAMWLKQYLHQLGCDAEIVETPGLPIVYAEDLRAGPPAPTILIYGHYDVQPVDPLEAWDFDPFNPVEKDGNVYARGAQDDKGQIFYAIAALGYFRESGRRLPLNIKFCIEGEEESGSGGLIQMLPKLKDKFKADDLLVIDFGILEKQAPSISLGARGFVAIDVVLRGSKGDLHSGEFGGVAYNPNRAAAELIAQLWDVNGRIAIPQFYDGVPDISVEEKQIFSSDEQAFIHAAGIKALGGEKGMKSSEACWLRPTIEVNGIAGGYAGCGFKTVIPAETRIKISCRLVPGQDPMRIGRLVCDFLTSKVKQGIDLSAEIFHGGKAFRGRSDCALVRAVSKAYEQLYHKPCRKILSGGSVPAIAEMIDALKLDVVGMGFGLASDNIHAPNEHFGLDRFFDGVTTVVRLIENRANLTLAY
jgi:acetylornithine deacetylase/succinyl-diaminopimelate desuccinylase-like protein